MQPERAGLDRWSRRGRQALDEALEGAGRGARGDVFIEEIHRARVRRRDGGPRPAARRTGGGAALRTWTDAASSFTAADGDVESALAACRGALAGAGDGAGGDPDEAGAGDGPLAPSALEAPALFLAGLEASLHRRLVGLSLDLEIEITARRTLVVPDSGSPAESLWHWLRLALTARTEGVSARWLGGAPDLESLRRTWSPQQLAVILDRRLRGALVRRAALPVCTPSTPVIFAAGTGGIVLHEFAHQLEADLVARGWSVWGDTLQAAPRLSPLLTLWDDPNRPRLRGSYAVDDEGQPGRRRLLVRRGRVVGRVGDRRHAEREPAVHPGHGRRSSWRDPPGPRASNLCLAAGDADPRVMREERGLQLLVHDIEVGGTDPRSGEITLRVSDGEWLDGGRPVAPVAALDLEGNVMELLGRVDRVGVDRHADAGAATCRRHGGGVPVGFLTPTWRAAGLREIGPRPAADDGHGGAADTPA